MSVLSLLQGSVGDASAQGNELLDRGREAAPDDLARIPSFLPRKLNSKCICSKCTVAFDSELSLSEHLEFGCGGPASRSHGESLVDLPRSPPLADSEKPGQTGSERTGVTSDFYSTFEVGNPSKCVQPYVCNQCGQSFDGGEDLVKHADLVHGVKNRFECELCDEKFRLHSERNKHRADVHHQKKPFHCDLCTAKFDRCADLNKHVNLVHRKAKRYKCPDPSCGKSFGLKVGATRHYDSVHLKKRNYECPDCGMLFGTNSNLSKHVGRKHPKS